MKSSSNLESLRHVTFNFVKDTVEALVKNVALQYCKIHEHATCSRAEFKCTCVPPTVPRDETCVVPLHSECFAGTFANEQLFWRKEYKALTNLVVPFGKDVPGHGSLFCPKDSSCMGEVSFYKLCLCNQKDKYGERCDLDPSHLVDHIQLQSLPEPYRKMSYLSKLHVALTQFEARMTLGHGDACDIDANQQLGKVMEHLNSIKQNCGCKWSAVDMKWNCRDYYQCRLEMNKDLYYRAEMLQKEAGDLLLVSKPLCNWIKGVRCSKESQCACSEDHFLENGECRLDSGMQCHEVRPGIDFPFKCRNGLRCGEFVCEIMHPVAQSVATSESTDPTSYLYRVFYELRLHLGTHRDLYELRTLSSRSHCHYKSEQILEELLKQLGSIRDLKEGESTTDRRQNVRLLESLANRAEAVKKNVHTSSYCGMHLTCDPSTSKCKSKDDGDGDKEKKKKPYTANASPVLTGFIGLGLCLAVIILSIS